MVISFRNPRPPNAPSPNGFWITETGREWASGSKPIPEDQEGYVTALDALVPNLDPIIREYAKEALITYNRRAFFSSAVMIGAASEKAVYLLMEALVGALTSSADKKFVQKTMDERRLPTMFKRLSEFINRVKSTNALPYAVHEGADIHLLSLQEAIRVQRNDAVHSIVGQVNPQTVRLSLSAFPVTCRKVYDLKEWFESNQL